MSKEKSITDIFEQNIQVGMAETVLTNGVVVRVPSSYSPKDRTGIIVHRVDYHIANNYDVLFDVPGIVASVKFGLAFIQQANPLGYSLNSFGNLDWHELWAHSIEVTAAGEILHFVLKPLTFDYSMLPGGGILAHPSALYAFCYGVNTAEVLAMYITLHYTTINLSEDMYRELWEQRVTSQVI